MDILRETSRNQIASIGSSERSKRGLRIVGSATGNVSWPSGTNFPLALVLFHSSSSFVEIVDRTDRLGNALGELFDQVRLAVENNVLNLRG
jgi:hypothetical protein